MVLAAESLECVVGPLIFSQTNGSTSSFLSDITEQGLADVDGTSMRVPLARPSGPGVAMGGRRFFCAKKEPHQAVPTFGIGVGCPQFPPKKGV